MFIKREWSAPRVAVVWQCAHQKKVIRATNCSDVVTIPQKKIGPHHEISSSQVVTIGDGLETLTIGLMELGGGHNGHYDHQWFKSPRGYLHRR
ncbi:hypothetical protein Syun_021827 [Stephania yunnanensis]|uniref:Uncharacterized protein n=1 Tax=Stephania yunnanensis TaxID=152371 RepID=A0AAP0NRG2_9MAGN